MPYKIYPCPECKYYEQGEDKRTYCNNVGFWGYRKELYEVVLICGKYEEENKKD